MSSTFLFGDKAIVRTPLFSLDYLYRILDSVDDNWILEILEDEKKLSSILINSPSFYHELLKYEKLNLNEKTRIRQTLLKYVKRFTTRCIPFGFFSGVGVIEIGSSKKKHIKIKKFKSSSKIDSNYYYKRVEDLLNNKEDLQLHFGVVLSF